MTQIVDHDFSTDVSADYNGAGFAVAGGVATPGQDGLCLHETPTTGNELWARITFGNQPAGLSGFAVGDASGNGELFVFDVSGGTLVCNVISEYDTYTTYAGDDDDPLLSVGTYVGGDQIGITIDLATNIVRVWNGVTAAEPDSLTSWDSVGPDDSYDVDTNASHALGQYLGFGSWNTGTPTDTYTRFAFGTVGGGVFDQEGFRWGVDDGNEAAHGWEAAQDSNITLPDNQSRLLRVIAHNTANDPSALAYTLRYQKNGSGGYVAVPVGPTTTTSPPTAPAATVTTIGTAADPWAINRPTASTGDLVVFVIAWDDSTDVTSVAAPSGVNGETAVSIAGPIASNSTEMRLQAWYYIATGAWGAGTLSFNPSASETCRAVAFVIPTAEFNAGDSIGFANTLASAGTAETNVNSPTGTAEGDDGNGRLYIAFGSDADALTAPGSNWNTINNATGGGVGLLVGSRNALVSNSESIAALTATIAGDSWASLCFVVKPNVVNNETYVTTSANIAGGGEATTARLTVPAGSPSFTTGRRWDDENGTDTTDLAAAPSYSEFEWLIALSIAPADGDFFDYRLYAGANAFASYSTTARWTVGSGTERLALCQVTALQAVARSSHF